MRKDSSSCSIFIGRSRIGGSWRRVLCVSRSPFFILYSGETIWLLILMFPVSMAFWK